MANDEIKDIANKIGLGDNKRPEGVLLDENTKAGQWVEGTATGCKLNVENKGNTWGVCKEKEGVALGTAIAAGQYADIISEGKVAGFIVNPGKDIYPGQLFWTHSTGGSLDITPVAEAAQVAKLVEFVANGATVAIVRIL